MFARMLGNCHGMTRAPMHNFLTSFGDNEDLVTFGSAAGAEYRHNPQRYDKPFRRVIKKPQVWMPTFHVINTKSNKPQNKSLPYSPLLECPCTPQRKIDVAAGTIDGQPPEPPIQCSPSFAATGNPSCSLSTYVGGWRCCEHGVFLIDTDKECSDPECSKEPEDEIFMKYTFYYEDATPETRHMEPSACCDVTGTTQGFENIEYDVPQCAAGTPPEKCLHVVETVQPVGYYQNHPKAPKDNHKADDLVDVVFASPHLHVAAFHSNWSTTSRTRPFALSTLQRTMPTESCMAMAHSQETRTVTWPGCFHACGAEKMLPAFSEIIRFALGLCTILRVVTLAWCHCGSWMSHLWKIRTFWYSALWLPSPLVLLLIGACQGFDELQNTSVADRCTW